MNKKNNVKLSSSIIYILLFSIVLFIYFATIFIVVDFRDESIEEYLFYYLNGIGNSDMSFLYYGLKKYAVFYIILLFSLLMFIIPLGRFKTIKLLEKTSNSKLKTCCIISIIFLTLSIQNMGGFSYIYNNIAKSDIIDTNYSKANLNNIRVEQKKNLLLIYLESFETTYFDKENGGDWDYDLMPEIYELLTDDTSIYFSTDQDKRGTLNIYGTNWTTASIISSTSGLPFKIPINNPKFSQDKFLNSVTTLGDVLKYHGYQNEVISGASTKFGGLYDYFTVHGNANIIDPDTVTNYSYDVDYDTTGAWGFNDKYMFDVAKKRLLELSKNSMPFNETLIGIDSHPLDGYKGEYTVNEYQKQYENVIRTDSKLLAEFISWVKMQDFYKDTVIVIVGDHNNMQTSFTGGHEKRGRLNIFINSEITPVKTTQRSFSSMDLYPTILSSMGYKIENDQLGVGVNLFSNKETILEKYGYEYVNKELKKKSLKYSELLRE